MHGRIGRDYERYSHRSEVETMMHLAMIDLMLCRLTGETTSN
ncbi:hypothetical protein [Streptomyces sp. NPDC055681]